MFETRAQTIAVCARGVCFQYNNHQPILNGINLTVNTGVIYGVFGASGSGKTTLLKCLLGRLKPKTGTIQIWENGPGTPGSRIPGLGVGYMPQKLSLYNELTIEEILTYFGRIYGMSFNEIKEKLKELTKPLQLSDKNRLIGDLSSGQKRRVSLSCALIHSPPLIILDEPTVGADPLLKRVIWHHLVLLRDSGHTIIVTTHNIEETRNANIMAFLTRGTILVEEEPNLLLNKYQSNNLEDVFLKIFELKSIETQNSINNSKESHCYENSDDLSIKESEVKSGLTFPSNKSSSKIFNKIKNNEKSSNLTVGSKEKTIGNTSTIDVKPLKYEKYEYTESTGPQIVVICKKKSVNNNITSNQKVAGFKCKSAVLLQKNLKRMTRNPLYLIYELLLPSLVLIIALLSMGNRSQKINLAIFDGEKHNNNSENLGQLFIKNIDKTKVDCFYYESNEAAIESVKSGQNSASIDICDGFTKAFRHKFLNSVLRTDLNSSKPEDSRIKVRTDSSNIVVEDYIYRYINEALHNFVSNLTGTNAKPLEVPLVFGEPIYGESSQSMGDFILPGLFVIISFYVSTAVTVHNVNEERKDGLLERSLVSGVTASEFLFSIFFSQFFILCLQTLLLILLSNILFDIHITGSMTMLISLLLCQGICGIGFGLALSSILTDITVLGMSALLLLISCMAISGIACSYQNMPHYIELLCKLMPNTLSIESLRDIMYRHWTLDYFEVYIGFVVTYVWLIFFVITALIFLKKLR